MRPLMPVWAGAFFNALVVEPEHVLAHAYDSRQVFCALVVIQAWIDSLPNQVRTFIANEYVYRGSTCEMAQLRILVPQLLEVVGYARVIIDGIDEYSKENQKAILKELQAICAGQNSHCKIFFSSRREVHIREKLSNQPQISLDRRQEVDFDIRSFVKYKVTKLRTADQALLGRIETILIEKADGMFLWVRLVLGELRHCYSDAAMEETAKTLPKGLKAAHKNYARFFIPLTNGILDENPKRHFGSLFILEEEYQGGRPFIWRENAHLDIAFSCTAVLNSCIPLLPTMSTDTERAAIIVQGFPGLQVYASKFWYKHVLDYCGLVAHEQCQVSPELLAQLQRLLRFKKADVQAALTSNSRIEENNSGEPGLEALSHVPNIKSLLSDILRFRAKMSREDASDKSPERFASRSLFNKHNEKYHTVVVESPSLAESLAPVTPSAPLGDQMKRGAPYMNNAGMPSPLPEEQSLGSPSSRINFNLPVIRISAST
ncbi:uncharacterized protein PAC_18308 [Phialocephala subalpina]|uniref:NACHT domain-containing protein n=1 Tax=Phialocephala subalpina TaxID=576137 RepID=A0A1L7XTQ7_9HELO|nr:uncharacterized protein PAC_18308 [Phialocephala subalpina]